MADSNDTGLQHPVPQNVIEIDFKLFGSFSLKQFSKVLFGALSALGLYLLPLPLYLKFPFMIGSVVLGVGSALVPKFSTWVSQYLKALFISPRYVWKKKSRAPEVLTANPKANLRNEINVNSAKNNDKIDLSEISLGKLLSSVSTTKKNTKDPNVENDLRELAGKSSSGSSRSSNLSRILGETYTEDVQKAAEVKSEQNKKTITPKKLITANDYVNEINLLKKQLNNLYRNKHTKEQEEELINKINFLYKQFQVLQGANPENRDSSTPTKKAIPEPAGMVEDEEGRRIAPAQNVFGIVVDTNNNLVEGAKISFKELKTGNIVETVSGDDGRFSTKEKLYEGEYDVTISHPALRFHTYKINVGNSKLPAYKFRSR
ncbi:MAG: carboxypeptidase-like regulatory domain-containing protein [Candidatus Dojkabacteria bacterium]|nr:carboxypeptidase-like regulatory domain-containing protein [Candidatus Dojkabacteria bacterium]MDQ7021788.1 carboxypeptidase-like regulatory domain-containing protein [Candidatus Dojkabacteria bacterium]